MTAMRPDSATLVDMFKTRAQSAPGALAIAGPDDSLTYRELDQKSDDWAVTLREHDVKPHDVVSIQMARSVAAICATLGVAKAGGVFLMLELSQPRARRNQMTLDADARLVITDGSQEPFSELPVITPADLISAGDRFSNGLAGAGDPAYIVYTSGSTGTPKGVLCDHAGLANAIRAKLERFSLRPEDRVALIAPLTVDASIFEIAWALCTGASLHIATEQERYPGPPLRRFLRERKITAMILTPTTLGSLDPEEHPDLRLLISAGEVLPIDLARRWAKGRRLVNLYGATEASIWSTCVDISGDEAEIPLGAPIRGCHIEVLKADLTPAGPDEHGELCIGGVGVARGYLNAPELTAKRFVDTPSGRLYRTGDIVVRRPDGRLLFIGREDDQIKLGGMRIELGEIRHTLLQHPAIHDVAVCVKQSRLVAYVVLAAPGLVKPRELIRWLEERLPSQMVPMTYVELEALPITPWGKIDANALPDPFDRPKRPDDEIVAPETPTQSILANAAKGLLGEPRVSITDDLFMLGMTSILLIRFMRSISEELAVEVEPVDIFQNPRILELAGVIDDRKKLHACAPQLPTG